MGLITRHAYDVCTNPPPNNSTITTSTPPVRGTIPGSRIIGLFLEPTGKDGEFRSVGIFRLTGDQGIRKFEECVKTQNAMPKGKVLSNPKGTSLDKSIASSPLYDIYQSVSALTTSRSSFRSQHLAVGSPFHGLAATAIAPV